MAGWRGESRRSLRLRAFDYSSAAGYFITICTQNREPILGEIVDGIVRLSDAGQAISTTWEGLEDRFPTIMTDAFVVMPNHVHGIVFLGAVVVRENGRASPTATEIPENTEASVVNQHVAAGLALPSPQPRLGDVIGDFKSMSAIRANRILSRSGTPLWQRNYHEHVIRNDRVLDRIREYIANNPANWAEDEENLARWA